MAETKRSEEHTSELQSRQYLVCRLLLEKKKDLGMLSCNPNQIPPTKHRWRPVYAETAPRETVVLLRGQRRSTSSKAICVPTRWSILYWCGVGTLNSPGRMTACEDTDIAGPRVGFERTERSPARRALLEPGQVCFFTAVIPDSPFVFFLTCRRPRGFCLLPTAAAFPI